LAFEFKGAVAPRISRGFVGSLETLNVEQAWIVCPVEEGYACRPGVRLASLGEVLRWIHDELDVGA
jgi:hypothetical protein